MKTCAIITEYNPFHNGHKYQLQKARELTGAEVIVVLMSGDFVQRGEPAIIAKQQRAEIALHNGADIVLELPFFGAVQAADYFGKIAVEILGELEIDALCFGTDSQTAFDYANFAKKEQQFQKEIRPLLEKQDNNLPYPKRLELVYQELFTDEIQVLNAPNHILGLAYARANQRLKQPMQLVPIIRRGASHYDGLNLGFASGTAIRKAAFAKELDEFKIAMPAETYHILQTADLHQLADYYPVLKTIIITNGPENLAEIYQMTEGLEYAFYKAALKAETLTEFIEILKSRRYTVARLQRLIIYVLLNITAEQMQKYQKLRPLKVLGFNDNGRKFLKKHRDKSIITTIRQQDKELLTLEQKVDAVYHLWEKDKLSFAKSYQPIVKC